MVLLFDFIIAIGSLLTSKRIDFRPLYQKLKKDFFFFLMSRAYSEMLPTGNFINNFSPVIFL